MTETSLFAAQALLPEGWAEDVRFDIAADGSLSAVRVGVAAGDLPRAAGPLLPGMPNLHSHAFQRAMAGLAERAGASEDSFWTWREVMYGFVQRLTPEQAEAIASQLYVEMLKSGYTAVGEFHYLHHGPDGGPYDDLAEMARRVVAAAVRSGIGMTLLPVLYGYGGFGGAAAGEGQRRFLNDPERLLRIAQAIQAEQVENPQVAVGLAPHSLRAVTPETLREGVAGITTLAPSAPVHIHIAEQTKEVADCEAWCGQRPVAWLLDQGLMDARWCLVHATHMTDAETDGLAASGAVAGLCPTTEANLGDGLFPIERFLAADGGFGIGSDSHISVSPVEELRWLEYGQRLVRRRRNLIAEPQAPRSVGGRLYRGALAGGAQALGRPIGALAPGRRADLIVLDEERAALFGKSEDFILDAFLFAGNEALVRDVMVGGRWVVRDYRHAEEEAILAGYKDALRALMA